MIKTKVKVLEKEFTFWLNNDSVIKLNQRYNNHTIIVF